MELGGDCGGEQSACSTNPAMMGVAWNRSAAVSQTVATATE